MNTVVKASEDSKKIQRVGEKSSQAVSHELGPRPSTTGFEQRYVGNLGVQRQATYFPSKEESESHFFNLVDPTNENEKEWASEQIPKLVRATAIKLMEEHYHNIIESKMRDTKDSNSTSAVLSAYYQMEKFSDEKRGINRRIIRLREIADKVRRGSSSLEDQLNEILDVDAKKFGVRANLVKAYNESEEEDWYFIWKTSRYLEKQRINQVEQVNKKLFVLYTYFPELSSLDFRSATESVKNFFDPLSSSIGYGPNVPKLSLKEEALIVPWGILSAYDKLLDNVKNCTEMIRDGSIHPLDLPGAISVARNSMSNKMQLILDHTIQDRKTLIFWQMQLANLEVTIISALCPVLGSVLTAALNLLTLGEQLNDLNTRSLVAGTATNPMDNPLGVPAPTRLEWAMAAIQGGMTAYGFFETGKLLGKEPIPLEQPEPLGIHPSPKSKIVQSVPEPKPDTKIALAYESGAIVPEPKPDAKITLAYKSGTIVPEPKTEAKIILTNKSGTPVSEPKPEANIILAEKPENVIINTQNLGGQAPQFKPKNFSVSSHDSLLSKQIREANSSVDYLSAIRKESHSAGSYGRSWDQGRFPKAPQGERWQLGDPPNMPDSKGNEPRFDRVRERYWMNRAFNELKARDQGLIDYDPTSSDPIRRLKNEELNTIRSKGNPPPAPGELGRKMELEHAGVPQRVRNWLEELGFSASDARRLSAVANPDALMELTPLEHAFFDAEAHRFGSQRADITGKRWAETPVADIRVNRPLEPMDNAGIERIVQEARKRNLDFNANEQTRKLRDALRYEITQRNLHITPP